MNCCSSKSDLSPIATDLQLINDLKECNLGRNENFDKVYVAIYDYNARTDEDLTFYVGDLFTIIDDGQSDWWFAQHDQTGLKGYISALYVASYGNLDINKWFHKHILRKEAEYLLLNQVNLRGTLLVRISEYSPGSFTLSVRDCDEQSHPHVKHYKIRYNDPSIGYYISARRVFSSLEELIEYYTRNVDGLYCQLTLPCPRLKLSTSKDIWKIPRNSLQFVKKINEGMLDEVWIGKWNYEIDVTIKTMKAGTISTEAFIDEANIMKKLHHDKRVQLYAICTEPTDQPIYIVIELMCNELLLDYLRHGFEQELKLPTLVDMAAQIACGMAYLEHEHYIHRDLAARNVLVWQECEGPYIALIEEIFSIKWTAPEAALYGKFTIKSDVWSYGILLYELVIYGQVPYPGMTNQEVLDQVQRDYRMPCPKNCPDKIYDYMLRCWNSSLDNRPTFEVKEFT